MGKKKRKGPDKMAAVEAALARMRARGSTEEIEKPMPSGGALAGYAWDAARGRYFPGETTTRGVKPSGVDVAPAFAKRVGGLGPFDLAEAVLRSRARAEVTPGCGFRPTCCASGFGQVVAGGFDQVRVLQGEAWAASSVTCVAMTSDGPAWSELGEGRGRIRTPKTNLDFAAWTFAIAEDVVAAGGYRCVAIFDVERHVPRVVMKYHTDALALALSDGLVCSGCRDGAVVLADRRSPSRGNQLRRYPAAVDDIAKVGDHTWLAADRRDALEVLDDRWPKNRIVFRGRRAAPAISTKVHVLEGGLCACAGEGHVVNCWRLADAKLVATASVSGLADGAALLAARSATPGISLWEGGEAQFVVRDDHGPLVTLSAKPRRLSRGSSE